jgi:hypothetical protein
LFRCISCNFINIPSALYCSHCGTALGAAQIQRPPPLHQPVVAPQRPVRSLTIGRLLIVIPLVLIGIIWVASQIGESKHRTANVPSRSPVPATQIDSLPAISYWRESDSTSAMDGVRTISMGRIADDSFHAWLGTKTPVLHVQCYSTGRRPDVYVDIKSAASVEYGTDSHTVRLRLDSGKPSRQSWTPSKDDEGLFSTAPTPLIGELKRHGTLWFEFDPFNTSDKATVSFQLAGLAESMAKHPECKTK